MQIIAFDLEPVVLPKDDPTWKFALGANPATEGVVLRLATEDRRGLWLRFGHRPYGLDPVLADGRTGALSRQCAGGAGRYHQRHHDHAGPPVARRPAGQGGDRLRASRFAGPLAGRAGLDAPRRGGARPGADPAHPGHQVARRNGGPGRQSWSSRAIATSRSRCMAKSISTWPASPRSARRWARMSI